MERSFLPIFAVLIGLGILVSFILNIYFDHQASKEIEIAINGTLEWTNNQDKESLLNNVVPEEVRVFKDFSPEIIKQREVDALKMYDLLSQAKYSLADFSVIRNKQRQGMALSADLLNTETGKVENYNLIAINYQNRKEDYKWIITNLLTFELKSKEEDEIEHRYNLVSRRIDWFKDRISKNNWVINEDLTKKATEVGTSDKKRERIRQEISRINEKINGWEQELKGCEEAQQQLDKKLEQNNIREKKTKAEQRKEIRKILTEQVDIEKRKRSQVETAMKEKIRANTKKLRDLVNKKNETAYLKWVTFDRDALSPTEIEEKKSEASKIFNELRGEKELKIDKAYYYATEQNTGRIVRVRFQKTPSDKEDSPNECKVCDKKFEPDPLRYNCPECKVSLVGPSGWSWISKTFILFAGICVLAIFILLFRGKASFTQPAIISGLLLSLIFSGLTIYSKEKEKAKHTPPKVYKPMDILFLEVMDKPKPVQLIPIKPLRDILLLCEMDKYRQIQWLPVRLIDVKDTQTLETAVESEWQKRASQCDFPSKGQIKRID